jgi:hypothetical protein
LASELDWASESKLPLSCQPLKYSYTAMPVKAQ